MRRIAAKIPGVVYFPSRVKGAGCVGSGAAAAVVTIRCDGRRGSSEGEAGLLAHAGEDRRLSGVLPHHPHIPISRARGVVSLFCGRCRFTVEGKGALDGLLVALGHRFDVVQHEVPSTTVWGRTGALCKSVCT
jgi:hypothetical protein